MQRQHNCGDLHDHLTSWRICGLTMNRINRKFQNIEERGYGHSLNLQSSCSTCKFHTYKWVQRENCPFQTHFPHDSDQSYFKIELSWLWPDIRNFLALQTNTCNCNWTLESLSLHRRSIQGSILDCCILIDIISPNCKQTLKSQFNKGLDHLRITSLLPHLNILIN